MEPHEAERVEQIDVVRASPHRLLQSRPGDRALSPARRTHATFTRTERVGLRDLGGVIVLRESTFVVVRQLESVTQLHARCRVVRGKPPRQLLVLGSRLIEVPGHPEQAHEETARVEIVRVFPQLATEQGDRFVVVVLPREGHRPRGHRGRRACRRHRNGRAHYAGRRGASK